MLVCGPRSTASIEVPSGVEVCGYVPRLYEHLAAAKWQSSRAEGPRRWSSPALRAPFIYFPLEDHFEQSLRWRSGLRGMGRASGCSTPRPRPSGRGGVLAAGS